MHFLQKLFEANREGSSKGIYAVCSAHRLVIEAALEQAMNDNVPALIEATANQVNQFGGYTGMRPQDFRDFVFSIATTVGFEHESIILGGDHLGPVCWTNEAAADAMTKSKDLISAYVRAGFKKIHLDCSMPCADDGLPLADVVVANRAAILCREAERTAIEIYGHSDLLYIVGTEVPPPGGTNEEVPELEITDPTHAVRTLSLHKNAFEKLGISGVWERVIGLVVQPGVEFSHTAVVHYDATKVEGLKGVLSTADNLVFEAHSTDYQLPQAYSELVQDHFAILKVGPQLTFALREALFALAHIEDMLVEHKHRSNLRAVCEESMVKNPAYWQRFYPVPEAELPLYRGFSYSDRIRYYWPDSGISKAVEKMVKNLDGNPIPLPLISQYFPDIYWEVVKGEIKNAPTDLIKAKIKMVTETYSAACWKQ